MATDIIITSHEPCHMRNLEKRLLQHTGNEILVNSAINKSIDRRRVIEFRPAKEQTRVLLSVNSGVSIELRPDGKFGVFNRK